MAEANLEKNDRMKEAFGISKYFVDGSSFDPARKEKEAAAKQRDQETKKQSYE